jgi:hypothetical protein
MLPPSATAPYSASASLLYLARQDSQIYWPLDKHIVQLLRLERLEDRMELCESAESEQVGEVETDNDGSIWGGWENGGKVRVEGEERGVVLPVRFQVA